MNITFDEFVAELDLPELKGMGTEEVATNFMPAAVAGLSDGDLVVIHPEPYTDADKIRLYGEYAFNHGLVAQRINKAAIATANRPNAVRAFQRLVADYCNMSQSPFYHSDMTEQNIKIYPEVVEIDGNIITLRQTPGCIVDYTACLSSRSILRNQIDFIKTSHRPFAYVALTRMHFTDLMLMSSYDRTFGHGVGNTMVDNKLYIGREDGIASATDEMIALQGAAGAPVNIADIILCNGGQHTTREDLQRGAENAFTLAKDEGLFIIRAFAKPSADEIGTDEIAEWAFEAGFKEQTALDYEASAHSVGAAVLKPQEIERAIKTLVLAK